MTAELVACPDPESEGLVAITRSGRTLFTTDPSVRWNEDPRMGRQGVYGVLSRLYPLGSWTLSWRGEP